MSASIRENSAPDAAPGSTGGPKPSSPAAQPRGPIPAQPAADGRADRPERAYSFGAYLRSHGGFMFGAVVLITVVAGIMAVTGSGSSAIALVSFCEALFACIALAAGFLRDRAFYQQLDLFCNSPENARYLSSILDEPRTLEGSIAFRALAVQGKAASDELAARSRDMKGYRNYIELWVHEAKTPIASAQLALSNLHGPEINKVRGDLDRIESRVEQALYYARSATLSEDFSIEELNLAAIARKACRQRSRTLIGAGVSLEFAIDDELKVLADAKWTDFIIGQVLENSAKYGSKTIRFESTVKDEGTKDGCIELAIGDDGDGIPAADVPRVFDRGFTGSRGRAHHKATGMGLYLAAVACERMGLGLRISSEEGTGTTVALTFPLDRTRMDLAANLTTS
ncbi:sensor histidine kinase [uncultured Senegalimassilia sp.]|uniref:sensor histidine kinase n=1 Tax=uncultured Senegalimassilia sp. TaxID=1714350 RepID=UPI0025DE62F9|nr:sensor histidine kinase [uncultured Senegalimassilia sp.]